MQLGGGKIWRVLALGAFGLACTRERSHATEPVARTEADASAASDAAAPDQSASTDAGSAKATPVEEVPCEEEPGVFLFTTPHTPRVGVPLRVLAVSDRALTAELSLSDASGAVVSSGDRHGGPPYFWIGEIESPRAGGVTATFEQRACAKGRGATSLRVDVVKRGSSALASPKHALWPARNAWSHTLENVYSAWIETLFDAPVSERPSWPALQDVVRDPKRNLLFDYLGADEDGARAPTLRPDCADLPYFLRAYFAFKLRLPFGVAECNRGGGGAPPSCKGLLTNEDEPPKVDADAIKTFGTFVRGTLADRAHSGSGRTPFDNESSDYYPVPLTWESLRPGTVYADPYGHVLVVARRIAQTNESGGILLAVDGQPDGTVARKRFWRGNFLYAHSRELGGPGFKRFRPLVRNGGTLTRPSDATIDKLTGYGDASRAAGELDTEAFYDRMDDVLSPRPLDPERALMEAIAALEEQVKTRVDSVDNGRKWLERTKAPATMPEGAEIFETTGAWEDFSTPSRDLRILIAIDVVKGFPARVARRPERYARPTSGGDLKANLERILERELARRTIAYTRTDGSAFTLTLADVASRTSALEMTYNPNDCVETRWGAPQGSPEASSCRAQAPTDQRTRMESYRAWFKERRRPPRK